MRHEFRLADIGEGLEEAEIVAWRVRVGDTVDRDAAIVEVMTDKSNADLPSPWSGTVVQLSGAVGEILRVGDVVAVIDDGVATDDTTRSGEPGTGRATFESAAARSPSFFSDTAVPSPEPVNVTPARTVPTAPSVDPDRPTGPVEPLPVQPVRRAKASPTTRREAVRRGIDLLTIHGSGPGGRVLLSDLDNATSRLAHAAAERSPVRSTVTPEIVSLDTTAALTDDRAARATAITSAQAEPGVQPLRGVRRIIAKNMAASWREVPHIHAWREIDAEPLIELRARLRDSGREAYATLTPLSFFVSAVAHGLRAFPAVNSSIDMAAETITTHAAVNVGVAVASPHGLVVPVIANADQLSLSELAGELADLVGRARSGTLGAEAFRGGTATITNFGSLGGESAAPILRPPEVSIIGFGSIAARPFVIDDEVVARKTMSVVVGTDHRLLDGDVTTAFLNHVCDRLIEPIDLALGL